MVRAKGLRSPCSNDRRRDPRTPPVHVPSIVRSGVRFEPTYPMCTLSLKTSAPAESDVDVSQLEQVGKKEPYAICGNRKTLVPVFLDKVSLICERMIRMGGSSTTNNLRVLVRYDDTVVQILVLRLAGQVALSTNLRHTLLSNLNINSTKYNFRHLTIY